MVDLKTQYELLKSEINEAMKIAAVHALKNLAREAVPAAVAKACGLTTISYGKEYIIPKPLDPRLLNQVSAAVAQAAVESGVAQLPFDEKKYS